MSSDATHERSLACDSPMGNGYLGKNEVKITAEMRELR